MEDHILWQKTLHQFRESSEGFDHVWVNRKRVFNTYSMVLALLNLCCGQEKSYRSALEHLSEELKCTPAASSFCVSRQKMPAFIIAEIRSELLDLWDCETQRDLFHGLDRYAIDASWMNLPRELMADDFKVASKGYYPRGLLTGAFRIADRMVIDLSLSASFDERDAAKPMLDQFSKGDLLIYDRGYFSYLSMLDHMNRGIKAVFRVPKGSNLEEIERAWRSEENDFFITLKPGVSTCRKGSREFPDIKNSTLNLRIIKYQIEDEEYMLITNLVDEAVTAKEFQALYWERWMIEEFFKPYKQTIKIEIFHSKTLNGVDQEIQAAGLLWNLTMIMDKMIPEDLKKTA